MATYRTPGVYVEEDLSPIGSASGGGSDAVAAFVGAAPRGPLGPVRISSWSQFQTAFGGFGAAQMLLPFAVYSFFTNGGSACYISRAVTADAATATVTINDDRAEDAEAALRVDAVSVGQWGNELGIGIVKRSGDRFDLIVRLGGDTDAATVERYPDCSINPVDPRYVVSIVNSPVSGSAYIRLTNLKLVPGYVYDLSTDALPQISNADLTGGSDGTGTVNSGAALRRLDEVSDALTINLPGETSASVINDTAAWAKNRGTAFLVIDGPQAPVGASSSAVAQLYMNLLTGASPITETSYAAIYGPWLAIADPTSAVPGAMRLIPPGGAVLGQFARNDATRNVAKAPAGPDTALAGVLDLETRFVAADTDALNDAKINPIRIVPGAGFCIMGARTLLEGYPDRYVPIRRTLITLRKDMTALTRFAIFEPNGPELWAQITSVLTQYLTTHMQTGVLAGASQDAAFFVKCDAENNPPQQVAVGRVNITVGVALRGPAEFIVITIGQYEGGTETTEQG